MAQAIDAVGTQVAPALVNICTIQIPNTFARSKVNREKMKAKRKAYRSSGQLKPITLKRGSTLLIDGYISYLLAKENGLTAVPVVWSDDVEKFWCDYRLGVTPTCYICGRKIPSGELSIDHVIPLAKGGLNISENKKPACKRCNQLKGTFDYSEDLVRVIKRERELYG